MSSNVAAADEQGLGDPADQSVSGVDRALPWLLVIGGVLGLIASFALTLDKFEFASNPKFVPNCDFNPLVSCSSVMNSPQGEAFGFPNPLIGLVAFGVVITVGMALLGGAEFPDWFWIGLLGGTFLGLAFIHWLAFESVFVLGKLCPWCMLVWAVTITLFSYTALTVVADDHFGAPAWLRRPAKAISKIHWLLPLVWALIFVVVIVVAFWNVWPTL